MKYLYLLVLLLLLTVETSAQNLSNSSDSSELSVLQKKWGKTWRTNSAGSSDLALDKDPFQANDEARQSNKDQKDYLREREIREKQGKPPESPRNRVKKPEPQIYSEIYISYTCQIKVKNNGTKTIQKVVWEYVFLDPTTKQEVGKHEFISLTNLKPGKTDNLAMLKFSPPTGTITAKNAGKKPSDLYVEQVNIKSIQYTDGSVWQADSK
jgi:hypothetical protein